MAADDDAPSDFDRIGSMLLNDPHPFDKLARVRALSDEELVHFHRVLHHPDLDASEWTEIIKIELRARGRMPLS